ncbi:MAG: Fe-S cluster assembly protein SufD [Bacteroidales bacterium]|nr:Fe-S cluster assembly protein SufD [Bacteroidales bacterium]
MNKTKQTYYPLEEALIEEYGKKAAAWTEDELPGISKLRHEAMREFRKTGFPGNKLEKWRSTDMEPVYQEPLSVFTDEITYDKKIDEIFQCDVHGFQARVLSLLNGSYYGPEESQLTVSPEGVIAGSLLAAQREYPELVEQFYGKAKTAVADGFKSANKAMARDGVFIYVPDGVEVKDTFQLIKILNKKGLMVHTRNLIVLGKNTKLTFLHCDDSVNHHEGFINTLSEVFIGENSELELYKLQNLNDETALVNQTVVHQAANSRLKVNVMTLNGGLVRNEIVDQMDGEGAWSDINGLFLIDKEQHVDNQVYVYHNVPHCESNQLFKGVLDEQSLGVFNGFVYVAPDAQKTNAFQQSSNILLSRDAHIDTMPQLEIYADDVKCSHGATVGQLDSDALFYLMQRGISFEDARMLLMYAFADEVLGQISIEPLRVNIEDMVKRRLRGELSICDRCVLHCSHPDKPIEFDIDLSKI